MVTKAAGLDAMRHKDKMASRRKDDLAKYYSELEKLLLRKNHRDE